MSGHSHWASIKHQKALADAKKGKVFSKMARVLTIAAKEKGGDPLTNANLRMAIEKAKEANMPKENIERAIKKGTGELEGEKLEEIVFEGFGPGGIAVIVECISDNKNRTLGDVKKIMQDSGGKMGGEGAVRWMFEKKGIITINATGQNREELELTAIEAGADDISWDGDNLFVNAKIENLEQAKKELESKGIKIESSAIEWIAKDLMEVSEKEKQQAENLFEALDENDDVQNIYSNLK